MEHGGSKTHKEVKQVTVIAKNVGWELLPLNNPVVIDSNFDDGNHDGWDCGTVHTCGSFGKFVGKKKSSKS